MSQISIDRMAGAAINITDWRRQIPGALNEDRTAYVFPTIVSTNARGKRTEWRIIVQIVRREDIRKTHIAVLPIDDSYFDNQPMPDTLVAMLRVESRIDGGKVRDAKPTFVLSGRNLGRANATNVFCQALRDALGLHNKQLKKAKTDQPAGAVTRYPPMLAQVLKDQKQPLFPANELVYVQRKYNGVRVVTTLDTIADEQTVIMYSRKKLLYPGFDYIKAEWLPVLKYYWEEGRQLYIDGEIYKHGLPLQDISGYARRETKTGDVKVNYMVYDLFIANEPDLRYSERLELLNHIFAAFDHFQYSINVPTTEATTMEEIEALYQQYLAEGYEGAMIRLDAPYRYSYHDYHSRVLLKMKPTYDEEYPIVGWETGEKGKAAEALMIICEAPNGQRFPVTPALELADRIALAARMNEPDGDKTVFETQWLGKRIRVYFDEKSKTGIPQRARTKLEREGIEFIK